MRQKRLSTPFTSPQGRHDRHAPELDVRFVRGPDLCTVSVSPTDSSDGTTTALGEFLGPDISDTRVFQIQSEEASLDTGTLIPSLSRTSFNISSTESLSEAAASSAPPFPCPAPPAGPLRRQSITKQQKTNTVEDDPPISLSAIERMLRRVIEESEERQKLHTENVILNWYNPTYNLYDKTWRMKELFKKKLWRMRRSYVKGRYRSYARNLRNSSSRIPHRQVIPQELN